MATMSKTDKLLRLLRSGRSISTKQLAKQANLKNLSATVHRLRQEGFDFDLGQRRNKAGRLENTYRLIA